MTIHKIAVPAEPISAVTRRALEARLTAARKQWKFAQCLARGRAGYDHRKAGLRNDRVPSPGGARSRVQCSDRYQQSSAYPLSALPSPCRLDYDARSLRG